MAVPSYKVSPRHLQRQRHKWARDGSTAAELSREDSRTSVHSRWARALTIDEEVLPLPLSHLSLHLCWELYQACVAPIIAVRKLKLCGGSDLLRATELDQIGCASCLLSPCFSSVA